MLLSNYPLYVFLSKRFLGDLHSFLLCEVAYKSLNITQTTANNETTYIPLYKVYVNSFLVSNSTIVQYYRVGQSPLESLLCPSGGHCATTPCLTATLYANLFIGTIIESLVDRAVSNSLFSNSCFVLLAVILWGLMPPSWWCWLFACAQWWTWTIFIFSCFLAHHLQSGAAERDPSKKRLLTCQSIIHPSILQFQSYMTLGDSVA